MSESDTQRCAMQWESLPREAQELACADAQARATGEWARRAGEYVPRPWNYLRERQWERKAIAKVRDRPAGAADAALETAGRLFMGAEK
jgi:hypothetical protein